MQPVDLPVVTEATFEAEVLRWPQPVMVYVWSASSEACRVYTPIIEVLSGTFASQARVVKIIADENSALLRRYDVPDAPALLLFKSGRLRDRLVGLFHQYEIAIRFARVVEVDE